LPRKPEASEIIELPRKKPAAAPTTRPPKPQSPKPASDDPGAEEFWRLSEQ
jgi:hypothetical protein